MSINLHIGGRPNPVTVEIVDIGARGARFRATPAPLEMAEEAGEVLGLSPSGVSRSIARLEERACQKLCV